MVYDCIIIGGGPSGMSAALVLGRANKEIVLFDEDKPRNRITNESHGFITRDGITPTAFKSLAKEDLLKYPSIKVDNRKIVDAQKKGKLFTIQTSDGQTFEARKILLATGLQDIFPEIQGLSDFYGKSLFTCPFCDGWELSNKKLVIISDNPEILHYVELIYNWSKDLVLCTNGKKSLDQETKTLLEKKNIKVLEDQISELAGKNGELEKIIFENGDELAREGGFVPTNLVQGSNLAEKLGCEIDEKGEVVTAMFGRTNIEGVFASGDSSTMAPAQLINAASDGNKAAIGMMKELVKEDFNS